MGVLNVTKKCGARKKGGKRHGQYLLRKSVEKMSCGATHLSNTGTGLYPAPNIERAFTPPRCAAASTCRRRGTGRHRLAVCAALPTERRRSAPSSAGTGDTMCGRASSNLFWFLSSARKYQ